MCIGVICLSIVNPVQVSAYSSELDTEINGNLTEEQVKDAIGSSIISYLLGAGADLIVPGSGQTVQALYDDINDVLGEALDIKDSLVGWFQDLQIRYEHPSLFLPWNWDKSIMLQGTPLSNAAEYYLQHRTIENNPQPQPDINYLPYIELINGKNYNYSYYLSDNWFSSLTSNNISGNVHFSGDPSSVSYLVGINNTYNQPYNWNKSGQVSNYIASYINGSQYKLNRSYTLSPFSIYINNIGNSYQLTTSELIPISIITFNNNSFYRVNTSNYVNGTYTLSAYDTNPTIPPNFSYYGSLEECFQFIAMNCRNVNIYVDGNPWSIITNPPDPIQIGGNTYLSGTNLPIEYIFPEGTLNDLALIKSILYQLIDLNNTGNSVNIKIDDILEAFTDENGQQAMYVIVVHRNDYDQLIMEQYPYRTVPGENNLALSRDTILESYNTQAKYLVKDMGTDVIPTDILRIIGAAGALLLVAYLINRMLE